MKTRTTLALAALAVTLAACSNGTDADTAYLEETDAYPVLASVDKTVRLDTAHTFCDRIESGESDDTIAADVQSYRVTVPAAKAILGAARAHICP